MDGSNETFSKASPGRALAEAAGLEWLRAAEAQGGARVVRVLGVTADEIELEQLVPARPTPDLAFEFGAALAATHGAGADAFGAAPPGWSGPYYLGRQELPVSSEPRTWGVFYATDRVLPYLERAEQRGHVGPAQARLVRDACVRIEAGEFDDDAVPSRLHGDLWNGNVVWTEDEAVLIDPAAHGGHAETDLAMLDLFGCPYLEDILAGYESASPLREGLRERLPLHQLHPLAVHAASHGASYAGPLESAARAVLDL
ncbi:fructosamine kinase family protein [Naasia aerilata]|uniref:Fructosamine kinase n=1 Tax=Naasia aerilata TaxID=1162966 RepID=A0ABM8GCV0_9MICO|nr:fructosamine kinase family protein [Naasia aerilata]BDZ46095.1 fructosamine kinase [Naasia aerilata]